MNNLIRHSKVVTGSLALTGLAFSSTTKAAAAEGEKVIFDFNDTVANDNWVTVNDDVMGGVSDGRFRISSQGSLEFFGSVSLENNGGFASIRSRSVRGDLGEFDGLLIRVRGDGKRYAFNLRTDLRIRAGSYRLNFDTKADTWQNIFLPFSGFEATSFGRVIRSVPPLDPAKIESFGFMISDKQEGPFKLEVDWICAARLPAESEDQIAPAENLPKGAAARSLIQLAIKRGVPLFNAGQPEACAAVYEVTATSLISLGSNDLPPSAVRRLQGALERASQAAEGKGRAWILRHALDKVLASLSPNQPG